MAKKHGGKTFYPTPKLRAKLEAMAKAQGRSFSNLLNKLLEGLIK